jgi:hypothetical protein
MNFHAYSQKSQAENTIEKWKKINKLLIYC